jgi:hypothetical protein
MIYSHNVKSLKSMAITLLVLVAVWVIAAQTERIQKGRTEGGPIVVHIIKPMQQQLK